MSMKEVIKSRGFTLERLAAEMTDKKGHKGIKQSSVSQIINGNPTLDRIKEIARVIGVTPSELIADSPSPRLTALVDCDGKLYKATSVAQLEDILARIKEPGHLQ